MTQENRNALYAKALKKWSTVLQFGMVMEECAELIRAVNRFLFRDGPRSAVIEECADVMIMVGNYILDSLVRRIHSAIKLRS